MAAVTGDCFLSNKKKLPESLNWWPQRLKLSVAGNHDSKETFGLLSKWNHTAPYACLPGREEGTAGPSIFRSNRHKRDTLGAYIPHRLDFTFVGLDTSKDLVTGKGLPPIDSDSCEGHDTYQDFDSDRGYDKLKSQLGLAEQAT